MKKLLYVAILCGAAYFMRHPSEHPLSIPRLEAQPTTPSADAIKNAVPFYGEFVQRLPAGLLLDALVPAQYESSGFEWRGRAVLIGLPNADNLAQGDAIGLKVLAVRDGSYQDGDDTYRKYRFVGFKQ